MISKIYNKLPLHFFMVIDTDYLAKWQYDLVAEIINKDIGICLGIINLNITDKVIVNKYSKKISDNFIFSSVFHNRSEALRNYKLKSVDIDVNTDELNCITYGLDQKVDIIFNFTEYDINFHDIITKYGVWSYSISSADAINTFELFVNSYLQESEIVTTRISTKLDMNDFILNIKENIYSSNHITSDEIVLFTEDLISSTLKLLSSNLKFETDSKIDHYKSQILNPFSFSMYVKFKCLHLKSHIRKLIQSEFLLETWSIGIKKIDVKEVLTSKHISNANWLDLTNEYYFVADPFLIEENDAIYVLAEAIGKESNKGLIVSYKVNKETLELDDTQVIFKANTHFSYPYTFEYEGTRYLLPESSETGELVLYKSLSLPENWEKVSVIIKDREILDASIFRYENKWWLFCSELSDGPLNKLKIWSSTYLDRGWSEHINNPVLSDARCGRPAGKPFYIDGKLYRPAQNSQKSYGGGLEILEILTLNDNEYKERSINSIIPEPKCGYIDGIHTLNFSKNYMIIDGKKLSFSFNLFFNYVLRKLKIKN